MPRINLKKQEARAEVFAEVYANTNSPSKAIMAAEPALRDRPDYAKVKAQRYLKRTDIQEKVQKKLEKLQKTALQQLPRLITSDNEQVATTNVWKVIEHVRGTPVSRSISLHANSNIEDALFE